MDGVKWLVDWVPAPRGFFCFCFVFSPTKRQDTAGSPAAQTNACSLFLFRSSTSLKFPVHMFNDSVAYFSLFNGPPLLSANHPHLLHPGNPNLQQNLQQSV